MKIVLFTCDNPRPRVGALDEHQVVDITNASGGSLQSLMAAGPPALENIEAQINAGSFDRLPLSQVRLLAPFVPHSNIFGIGLNYKDHAAESKMQTQAVPTVFMKLASSVAGPGDDILLPNISTQPDYEAELGVVIGKEGHKIAASNWRDHIFGYTIVNDVSARDIQLATSQWTLGKSFPTFTPLGPCIATAQAIPDPHSLEIELTIDGERLQHANTRDLIFRIPQLIEYVSSIVPLQPGDIISTGTPAGVGLGRTPQRWLKPGEEVSITIEAIGTLKNRTR